MKKIIAGIVIGAFLGSIMTGIAVAKPKELNKVYSVIAAKKAKEAVDAVDTTSDHWTKKWKTLTDQEQDDLIDDLRLMLSAYKDEVETKNKKQKKDK